MLSHVGWGCRRESRPQDYIERKGGAVSVEQQVIVTNQAPEPIGPFSQAIQLGQTVYVSGQIGVDRSIGKLAATDIEAQTRQALKNMEVVLRSAGSALKQVVKTTVHLPDLTEFKAMNAVHAQIHPQGFA